MPELLPQNIFLNYDNIDDKGVGKGGPAITFDEDHEVAKSDEHHDVDILIHGIIGFVKTGTDRWINFDIDVKHEEKDDLIEDTLNSEAFKDISSLL